jgi:hypothetical protein
LFLHVFSGFQHLYSSPNMKRDMPDSVLRCAGVQRD